MSGFDDRMAQLRVRFIVRAQDERVRIEAAAAAMDRGEIKRLSHGLAGSAGVFGFSGIGDEAQAVEEAVDENAGDGELRRLCAVLVERLARAGQED